MTIDHRVDFQRASHVLANAQTNPALNQDKKQRMMSMHRVSEHREEEEVDHEDHHSGLKKRKVSGLNMTAAEAIQEAAEKRQSAKLDRDSPSLNKSSKLSNKMKSHMAYNNQWTLDEEDRNRANAAAAAAAASQAEGEDVGEDETGPQAVVTESPSK